MAILIIKISSIPTWEERQGASMFLSPSPGLCEAMIPWIQICQFEVQWPSMQKTHKRHPFHLNLWTILERRMKTSSSANLLPTHMRVPWPKGRLTKGWTDCWKQKIHLRWHTIIFFSTQGTTKKQRSKAIIMFGLSSQKLTYSFSDLIHLSGRNTSGLLIN